MSNQSIPPASKPPASNPGTSPSRPPESSGQAIASLVLGILSLTCFGLFSGIPAIVLGKSASRKIRESAGTLTGSGLAQAGVITGWVGTILSLAGAVVFGLLPVFSAQMKSKSDESFKRACYNYLMMIEGAKQQWALESKSPATSVPTWENLRPYFGRGASSPIPQCPAGGSYQLNDLQTAPECSVPGHTVSSP